MKNKKTIRSALLLVLVFALGIVLGWSFPKKNQKVAPSIPTLIREDSSNYKFIHPVLLLQIPEDDYSPEFQSLKKTISTYIKNAIGKNNASDVSVYFRDLNTNNWTGINADDTYSPASMLKVVTLISFFRASETNPNLLNETVYLDVPSAENEDDSQDYYPSADQAKLGNTYTTQQLLSYMIIDSDNNAALAINSLVGNKILNQTYTDLKIPSGDGQLADNFMTVKMYSRLWRALYDGTYISQAFSEQALSLLSQTTFTKGLVAGIPSGIIVAHKFGERTIQTTNSQLPSNQVINETHELHDCGIVYAPNDPYFICVMTKGNSFTSLQTIISDISDMVWKETEMTKDN